MSSEPASDSPRPVPTPDPSRGLRRSFYRRSTPQVAEGLLGKWFARRLGGDWIGGRIVETEAYLAEDDLASHSARGRTRSNAAMFGPPGSLYVYPIHAKHCLNVVTEQEGRGAAVLIRALEPLWGIETMQRRRGRERLRELTRGPAMLCQALDVDRRHDGVDLVSDPDWLVAEPSPEPPFQITCSTRIGLSRAADMPLRFFVNGNRFVSGKASDHR